MDCIPDRIQPVSVASGIEPNLIVLHYYSVLKTFIHDPLVEWEKVKGRIASAEATNEKVWTYIAEFHQDKEGGLIFSHHVMNPELVLWLLAQ